MFLDRSVLVVVPARGGSKGIPLKNLRSVGGVSLVARTGYFARQLDFVDRAIVSTDHPDIAAAAREAGLDAPFFRPAHLSGDRVGDWPVLGHALEYVESMDGKSYEIILMLQPTSPLRTKKQVRETVAKLVKGGYDAVWTVSATDLKFHPLKQLTISDNGDLEYYDSRGSEIVARQQLEPVYHRNGIAYAMTRDCLVKQGTIKGSKTGAVVIDEPVANIDTEADIRQLEELLAATND